MTAQSTQTPVYLDHDTALQKVRDATQEAGIEPWLMNATALLLASAEYRPERGYLLDEGLLRDPEHLRRFTGIDLATQAHLGARLIVADDPTNGRRSQVTSIATPERDQVIVTFSTGDRLSAAPIENQSAIVWNDSRKPDEGGRISWIGHDRFALKLREVARELRRQSTPFNPDAWLLGGYRDIHGGHGQVGPALQDRTIGFTPGVSVGPPPQIGPSEKGKFTTRCFELIRDKTAEWAAAEGIELTLVRSHGPNPPPHPALAAVLARITITLTGPIDYADGWTIHYNH